MSAPRRFPAILGVLMVSLGCAFTPLPACAAEPAGAEPATWTDASGFVNRRVQANETVLHAIDYGGHGPALVFLAGLGNSAHVFDDFAPRFTDSHHVVALTRRGYGESGRPRRGYDTANLALDIREMLDSLGIDRAVLAGHSVAGDELAEFAVRWPERTAGVVFLDAAYDRSHTTRRLVQMAVLGQLPPAPPGPNGPDRASAAAAGNYLERLYGVRWPASEVAATRVFDTRGRWVRDATPASTNAHVLQGELPPRWGEMASPALAIYAVDRGETRDFPWIGRLFVGRGAARLRAMRFEGTQRRWEAGQRERFAAAQPSARVVEVRGASHYVFLSHPELVEREMRAFLAGLLADS